MKDNFLNNIGDILIVKINSEISGKVIFTGYDETIIGETNDRTLNREFRISVNDIFWTDWLPLNDENLSSRYYESEYLLQIEIRYTRTGVDNTGVIEFQDIQLIGSVDELYYNEKIPTILSSIFSNIINRKELKQVENNLFKKLYHRGILPNYIIRGENIDETEDKDFIALFSSISKFFGMLISFFKRFENLRNDFDLIREYLRQYGIYFDESNTTLEDLQYLAQHFYDEIRKRGTEMIFKRKGESLLNEKIVPVDGEFLRLLRNKESDELVYENIPLERIGWCLGNSSPLYKGTSNSNNLNKTREDTEDFQKISNYVISNIGNSLVSFGDLESKKVLNFSCQDGICGLGRYSIEQDVSDKVYTIDSKLDYEITFAFKKVSGANNSKILFGVEGFDSMKNKLTDAFISSDGNSVSEIFIEEKLTNFRNDSWYFVRGIIHSYSSIILESKTNIGFGTNLYFNNPFVKYILPKIQLISDNNISEINIWNYKIRPLIRGTNILSLKNGSINSHSLGFIQSSNIFYTYVRNNNNSQSESEITNIIEKYLYPFNVTNIFVMLHK